MPLLKTIPSFPVRSITKAVDFYKNGFAFDCRHQEAGFAILQRDNIELQLWASCDHSWKWRSVFLFLRPIWSGAESFLAGTHSCRIEVQNIEDIYEEFKLTGVLYNSRTQIETTWWGTKEFPCLDLYGNLLTFYERIRKD